MNQFQFQQQQNQIQQNMQIGSGLTRYRSAPSSYFDSFLNGDDDLEHLLNHRVCSPETQRIFARFMSGGDAVQENCAAPNAPQSQIPPPRKDGGDEPEVKRPRQQLQRQQSRDFSSISPANCDVKSLLGGPVEANRGVVQVKTESHSLVRHSSSPAGLFDSINIEEFGAMRGIGNSGAGNIANAEGSFSSASRCKSSQMDLPPRTPSSSAKMGPVSGLGNKGIRDNRPLDGQFNEYRSNDVPNFPSNQWDDSILSDDFFKGLGEDDIKPFPKATVLDDQKNDGGNRTSTRLSHHLSLPKSCAAMENLLEDSVPCKLRAKRGFATHPRSIAERVRRTKISERIRKLQELVPNMDKQTNTADMLDLAVDYIKDLQRQVKTLSDNSAKCGCCAKEKS